MYLGCVLGDGTNGTVYECEKNTVLKKFKSGFVNCTAEIDILFKLRHKSLCVGLKIHQNEHSTLKFGISMERITFSIQDYLNKTKPSEEIRSIFVFDICSAVHFLHSNNYIHRDISARNIMLDIKNGQCIAKLIDYGDALIYHRTITSSVIVTTSTTRSYENFVNNGLYIYNNKTDIWSLGIITIEIFSGFGFIPYRYKTQEQIEQELKLKVSSFINPENIRLECKNKLKNIKCRYKLQDLLLQMLNTDNSKRCDIEYVMKHPIFTEYYKNVDGYIMQESSSVPIFVGKREDELKYLISCIGKSYDLNVLFYSIDLFLRTKIESNLETISRSVVSIILRLFFDIEDILVDCETEAMIFKSVDGIITRKTYYDTCKTEDDLIRYYKCVCEGQNCTNELDTLNTLDTSNTLNTLNRFMTIGEFLSKIN